MFLIDANLPKYISVWNSDEFTHVSDLNDLLSDSEIWNYARENNLIIITKDSDFYYRILLNEPPPKVIYLKLGNLRIYELVNFLKKHWDEILKAIEISKMIIVSKDKIRTIS